MRSTLGFTNRARIGALLFAALVLAGFQGQRAEACPHHASLPAPAIEDAGFEPPRVDERGFVGGHLWVRLEPSDPLVPSTYVIELIGGRAPTGLGAMWGHPLSAENDQLFVPITTPVSALDLTPPKPFVFGFQVRGVDASGKTSPPSTPIWISFDPAAPARAVANEPPRSDHVLFFLVAIGLAIVWYWYRRESSIESKIRLAALAALASVVFLSVTSAMPWMSMSGDPTAHSSVLCLLGQETSCVHRAGITLGSLGADGGDMSRLAFELQRWQCASAALRMGQVTALALLLPALIWLMVDPRHRAAQAATAVGASVAGFTWMVVLLYRHSVPTWLDADLFWTADIALMTTANIVIASVLVVRQSFALIAEGNAVPRAIARYR